MIFLSKKKHTVFLLVMAVVLVSAVISFACGIGKHNTENGVAEQTETEISASDGGAETYCGEVLRDTGTGETESDCKFDLAVTSVIAAISDDGAYIDLTLVCCEEEHKVRLPNVIKCVLDRCPELDSICVSDNGANDSPETFLSNSGFKSLSDILGKFDKSVILDGIKGKIKEKTETIKDRFTSLKEVLNFDQGVCDLKKPDFSCVSDNIEDLAGNLPDIEFTIPYAMPETEITLTVKVVLHTVNLIADKGNYATVFAFYNDSEAAHFVLNENYAYLNANALFSTGDEEYEEGDFDSQLTFYHAFECDGEPATFKEVLRSYIYGLIHRDKTAPIEDVTDYDENDETEEDDDPFRYGYGYDYTTDEYTTFDIGATEEDFRSRITVFYFDENDEPIEYTDYRVAGFDGSTSFSGKVYIYLSDDNYTEVEVLIYDHETFIEMAVIPQDTVFETGTTVYALQEDHCIYARTLCTDTHIVWEGYADDFTITEADGEPVTKDYAFDAGDYTLTVVRNGVTYRVAAHVYDLDAPIPVEFECSDSIDVWEGYTEDDVRNQLSVYVIYDSLDGDYVYDYEIVGGFTYGAESIVVKWGEFEKEIPVYYIEGYTVPEEDGLNIFTLFKYIRHTDFNENDEPAAAIARMALNMIDTVILNKELFAGICTTEKTASGRNIRFAVNSLDDKDVLAVLNLFFGVPEGDGWKDMDADFIAEAVSKLADKYTNGKLHGKFEQITGYTLSDVCSDLYLNVSVNRKGDLSVEFSLESSEGEQYFVTGVSCKLIDALPQSVLTDAEKEKAHPLSLLVNIVKGLI